MVILRQILKMPKTCEKPFYKNIQNRSVEKTARKNTKYSRNETSLKIGQFCKGYSPCKVYRLCKMVSLRQKLKMPKTCEKPFYKNI